MHSPQEGSVNDLIIRSHHLTWPDCWQRRCAYPASCQLSTRSRFLGRRELFHTALAVAGGWQGPIAPVCLLDIRTAPQRTQTLLLPRTLQPPTACTPDGASGEAVHAEALSMRPNPPISLVHWQRGTRTTLHHSIWPGTHVRTPNASQNHQSSNLA